MSVGATVELLPRNVRILQNSRVLGAVSATLVAAVFRWFADSIVESTIRVYSSNRQPTPEPVLNVPLECAVQPLGVGCAANAAPTTMSRTISTSVSNAIGFPSLVG